MSEIRDPHCENEIEEMEEFERCKNLHAKESEIEEKIKKLQLLGEPRNLSEWKIRDDAIAELRAKLAAIKQEFDKPYVNKEEAETVTGQSDNNTEAQIPAAAANIEAPADPVKDESGLTKREKQIRAIEAVVEVLGYQKQRIPNGGKTTSRNKCKKDYPSLFGAGNSPFDDAWKEAISSTPPRLRMADHNKFAGK